MEKLRIEIITPERASELLQSNTNNRNVRANYVRQLASSMRKGEWKLSNDAITISKAGILLNGQHRLLAVKESGVSCPFIILVGVSDDTFDIMDIQSKRSLADVLRRKGSTGDSHAAAGLSVFNQLREDYLNSWSTIHRFSLRNQNSSTRVGFVELYEEESELFDRWNTFANRVARKGVNLMPKSLIIGLASFLERVLMHDVDKIQEFFENLLIDGSTTHKTLLLVRKRLMEHRMRTRLLKNDDRERYIIRAWNDFIRNKESSRIEVSSDNFQKIYPL